MVHRLKNCRKYVQLIVWSASRKNVLFMAYAKIRNSPVGTPTNPAQGFVSSVLDCQVQIHEGWLIRLWPKSEGVSFRNSIRGMFQHRELLYSLAAIEHTNPFYKRGHLGPSGISHNRHWSHHFVCEQHGIDFLGSRKPGHCVKVMYTPCSYTGSSLQRLNIYSNEPDW